MTARYRARRWLRPDTALTLVGVLWCVTAPAATVFEMGEEFHTVTTEVATPHVAWAKPLASGPLHLLVVAPRFAHRETAELMQRLDAECDVVMTHSHKELGASAGIVGLRESEVLDALRQQLSRPHDVIVIGNLDWSVIPKPVQYEILRQVSEGTGLLYVPFAGDVPELLTRLLTRQSLPELLLQGVPWGALPSLEPGPVRSEDFSGAVRFLGTLKQGRCVALRWNAGAGGFHCLTPEPKEQLEYDYDMAVVARALLWLAHREPDPALRVQCPATGQGQVLIDLPRSAPNHVVEAVVRDRFHEVEFGTGMAAEAPQVEFALPEELKGGRHFVDVWVRESRDGPVLTWGSAYFDMKRDGAIESVATEETYYRRGDTVRATVTFASKPAEPAELVLSALDIHGREWARLTQALQAGAGSATLTLEASGMLSTYNRLRADLVRDGKAMQRAFGDLYVPLRQRPDFALGAWGGGGSSWLSYCRHKWGHDLGLTTAIFEGDITAGVRGTPYSTTSFRHGGKGDIRNPCLTDPGFWEKERGQLTERAKSSAHADLFAYSLGDEICLDVGNTSLCRSPTCLAGFRDWLRDRYDSLDALNAEWGTEFAEWEQVEPKSRTEAEGTGNLAPWLDHRLFMDGVFTRGLARARDIIHELDPDVPVGAEGLWGSTSAYGMDWWPLAEELDYLMPYWRKRLMVESIRSFRRPGTITGTWYGNYGEQGIDEEMLRWFPWNVLLHQYNSVWWYPEYRAVQFGAVATALAPDYRPTVGFQASLEEIAEIRSGIGTLLLNLRREHDGIGVLYSRPSIHVWGADHADELLTALEDLGFQYNMLPAAELSAAKLKAAGYRLLILPGACVLSGEQASQIEAFVEQGGSVLAALVPGVHDEHGRPLAEASLAGLFGASGATPRIAQDLRRVSPAGGEPFDVSQTTAVTAAPDATVVATFDDDSPAATYRTSGNGTAALLAFSFKGLTDGRTLEDADLPMRSFLSDLLRRLGVSPTINIGTDRPIRGLELARFTDGTNEYIAMTLEPLHTLRHRDHEPRTFRLRFPDQRLTYDVRAKRRLGTKDELDVELRPGECRLFGRLTEEPKKPTASVQPDTARPGESVTVTVQAPGRSTRVLRMTVAGPDGAEIAWWARNVLVESGAATVRLDVALNAAPGRYTIAASDVVTGQRTDAAFTVAAD